MLICLPFQQYLAQNLRGSTFLEASCQLQSGLRSPANDPIDTTMKMIYDLKNSVPEEEKMKPNIKICGWWMEHLSPWDIHHYPGNTSRHSRGLKVFGISELAALQKKIACLHKSSIIDQQKLTTFAKKQQNELNGMRDLPSKSSSICQYRSMAVTLIGQIPSIYLFLMFGLQTSFHKGLFIIFPIPPELRWRRPTLRFRRYTC